MNPTNALQLVRTTYLSNRSDLFKALKALEDTAPAYFSRHRFVGSLLAMLVFDLDVSEDWAHAQLCRFVEEKVWERALNS